MTKVIIISRQLKYNKNFEVVDIYNVLDFNFKVLQDNRKKLKFS